MYAPHADVFRRLFTHAVTGQYRVLIYSVDGTQMSSYSAYEHALGVKSVAWSPSGQLLAIGSFDQRVRLLNHLTWKNVLDMPHVGRITLPDVPVYVEEEKKTATSWGFQYTLRQPPITVPQIKVEPTDANPRLGVGMMAFSPSSRFIASRNDNMPETVWVWDVPRLALAAVLIHRNPVLSFRWDPKKDRLAVATGTGQMFLWAPAGASVVDVPAQVDFCVQNIRWAPTGEAVALVDRTRFCVGYSCEDNAAAPLEEHSTPAVEAN
jgi:WD40 repeat protein